MRSFRRLLIGFFKRAWLVEVTSSTLVTTAPSSVGFRVSLPRPAVHHPRHHHRRSQTDLREIRCRFQVSAVHTRREAGLHILYKNTYAYTYCMSTPTCYHAKERVTLTASSVYIYVQLLRRVIRTCVYVHVYGMQHQGCVVCIPVTDECVHRQGHDVKKSCVARRTTAASK